MQEDLGKSTAISGHFSRPPSRAAHDGDIDQIGPAAEAQLAHLQDSSLSPLPSSEIAIIEGLRSRSATPGLTRGQSLGTQSSQTFAAAVGASLSRNATPEPQLIMGGLASPSPAANAVNFGMSEKQNIVSQDSFTRFSSGSTDLATAFSGLNIASNGISSTEKHKHVSSQIEHENSKFQNQLYHHNQSPQNSHVAKSPSELLKSSALTDAQHKSYSSLNQSGRGLMDFTSKDQVDAVHLHEQSTSLKPDFYMAAAAVGVPNGENSSRQYQSSHLSGASVPNYGLSAYPINPMLLSPMMTNYPVPGTLPPMYDNVAAALAAASIESRGTASGLHGATSEGHADLQNLYRASGQMGAGFQMPMMDGLSTQHLQRTTEYAARMTAGLNDSSIPSNYAGGSYVDFLELQKAYLNALLTQQQSQYGMPYLGRNGNGSSGYYGSPPFGFALPYAGSPIGSPVMTGSSMLPGTSSIRHNERNLRHSPGSKGLSGGLVGSWHPEKGGDIGERYGSSLLEEFKNNKNKCTELSDIAGQVVEFRYW